MDNNVGNFYAKKNVYKTLIMTWLSINSIFYKKIQFTKKNLKIRKLVELKLLLANDLIFQFLSKIYSMIIMHLILIFFLCNFGAIKKYKLC
jgi:hypothetical protein